MRAALLITTLAFAVPVREGVAPQETRTVREQLIGRWRLVKAVREGRESSGDSIGGTAVFTRDMMVFHHAGQDPMSEEIPYRLVEAKTQATIDLTPKGTKLLVEGIVRIESDTLTICFAYGGKGVRPTEFTTAQGSNAALLQFQRIHP